MCVEANDLHEGCESPRVSFCLLRLTFVGRVQRLRTPEEMSNEVKIILRSTALWEERESLSTDVKGVLRYLHLHVYHRNIIVCRVLVCMS